MEMNFRIRVLRAIDYPEIAQEYRRKHHGVLEKYEVAGKIDSLRINWWHYLGSYLVIAEEKDTGEIVAGIRLDIKSKNYTISMEDALKKLSTDFVRRVQEYDDNLAEACGWWVHEKYSKIQLPFHLLRAGVVVSTKLGIKSIIGFPHQYSINITQKLGFTIVDDIGDQGSFIYPDERYKSSVVEINDTHQLDSLNENERNIIMSLRENPNQKLIVESNGIISNIEYDLEIMQKVQF